MAGYVGRRDQSGVLGEAQVCEMGRLGQHVNMSRNRRLYFGKLSFKIFDKYLLQSSTELDRFFPDYFETLIERFQILLETNARASRASFMSGFWAIWLISRYTLALRSVLLRASLSSVTKTSFGFFAGISFLLIVFV